MIIKVPQKTFTKKEIRNWLIYKPHLKLYPTVAEYLESIFKKWIIILDVPLSILWLRQLIEEKLNYLEKLFIEISQKNSALLNKIKTELDKENTKYAYGIINKINSLSGEILSMHFLSNKFALIEPLKSVGDFLCDKKVTVSVKTKSDVNFNLEIIENYIFGLLYNNEMKVLKDYKFHLKQIDGIDDDLREAILVFLKENLISFIDQLPEPRSEYDYNSSIEKIYSESIKIKGDKYIHKGRKKITFEIMINNKRFELSLSENKNPIIAITKSTDVYYPDNEIYNIESIEKSIDSWIDEFDKKSKIKEDFWGYVNIPVAYLHERGFMRLKEDLKIKLGSKCISKNYKTIFCFYPTLTFEMRESFFFEFNPLDKIIN
jgi:hypothetical protein